jgi:hypothetical protein
MLRFKKKFYNGFHDEFINIRRRCKRTLYPCYEKTDRTQNDEAKSISKNAVYEEACASSSGIGAFDSTNITLKNRVFEELFTRGHISQGNNSDEVKITDIGKNYPEYLDT